MIHFDLPKQKSSIIKVLGIGGGGSNAVNFMFEQDIVGVDFIICNTDAKAIEQSDVPNKIQLGPHLTQGLGAGADPEVGKKATEESLQEIRSILEVNTKMAFITVGMGGGTGTGGAPIVAQICKDLGILTVGIVTTPFSFEGPRRMQQAEAGIKQLKPYVDTLLVISNDKLRMQYGNLKMKEAFAKADNVLATAAKCITDIINSRGHIIVDFSDVCTVMKNGGVAILGKAEVEGENRAERAIEEALTSPLLNDNDIKGAKWILSNINSAEGEHECTMDELEIINNYLRMQAGENTDVIVGMGYDNTLDKKLGITLVATGFGARDPFAKQLVVKKTEPKPEKIVMALNLDTEENKTIVTDPAQTLQQQALPFEDKDPYAPQLVIDEIPTVQQAPINIYNVPEVPMPSYQDAELVPTTVTGEDKEILRFELTPEITVIAVPPQPKEEIKEEPIVDESLVGMQLIEKPAEQPVSASFLSKPSRIYAEPVVQQKLVVAAEQKTEQPIEQKPVIAEPALQETHHEVVVEEHEEVEMLLTEKTENVFDNKIAAQEGIGMEETEEQKKKAFERIQKLRTLSYNMNAADPNNDFEAVPAYIRRNMELFGNTMASVDNYYSKYTVTKDDNDQAQISSLNTFMFGKKPD